MEEHLDIQDFERAFGVSKAHIPNYLNKEALNTSLALL